MRAFPGDSIAFYGKDMSELTGQNPLLNVNLSNILFLHFCASHGLPTITKNMFENKVLSAVD